MFEVTQDSMTEFLEKFPEARRYRPVLHACYECATTGLGFGISQEGLDAVRPLLDELKADSPEAVAFLTMTLINLPDGGDIPVPFELLVADESGIRATPYCPHRGPGSLT